MFLPSVALSKYAKLALSDANIKHNTFDYGQNTQGIRHPYGPLGVMLRDQGQVDIYAGGSRLLLGLKGEQVSLSTINKTVADRISFSAKGISNFRILGRSFSKKIHEGQKVVAIKKGVTITGLSVIGPETKVIVDGVIGDILNPVPMIRIFDERAIFEDPDDTLLLVSDVEIFNYVNSLF